jgi:hypothetical protein
MIKDEIENTPSTDGQVHVVVQFVLHVPFVQFSVDLSPRTLKQKVLFRVDT